MNHLHRRFGGGRGGRERRRYRDAMTDTRPDELPRQHRSRYSAADSAASGATVAYSGTNIVPAVLPTATVHSKDPSNAPAVDGARRRTFTFQRAPGGRTEAEEGTSWIG